MKISKLVLNLSLAVMAGMVSMQASAAASAPKKSAQVKKTQAKETADKKKAQPVAGVDTTAFVCKNQQVAERNAKTAFVPEAKAKSQDSSGSAAKPGKS